jgi:preprotein translocase subunit SecD
MTPQNHYPLWRYALILAISVLGALYALPNLYGFDPALQLSARRSATVDHSLETRITGALGKAGVTVKSTELASGRLLIRFPDDASRIKAMPVMQAEVDTRQYLVALNLAPATPPWLRNLGGKPMYMGLDLRGGVHFLMQVDIDEVRKQTEERFVTELRSSLRDKKIRFRSVSRASTGGIEVTFLNQGAKTAALEVIGKDFRDLDVTDGGDAADFPIKLQPKPAFVTESRKTAIKQNLTTLRNRINEFGVAEPVIQQQGDRLIVFELCWVLV